MKNIKKFENFEPSKPYSDPGYNVDNLNGKNREVYEHTENIIGELYNYDFFERWCERNRVDPIITSIIDQNATWANDNPNRFPNERKYYVFINNYNGKEYIELEINFEYYKGEGRYSINVTDADISNHGYPGSYGKTIYSFNKNGEMEFDEDFWF